MTYPDYRGDDGPVAIRYNNPGAQWPGASSRKFGAHEHVELNDGLGQGNKAAIFPTAVHGAAALFDLLYRVYTNQSLEEAITRWSGGNNVQSYLNIMRTEAKLMPSEKITKAKVRNFAWAAPFAKAMAKHESGQDYPLTIHEWRAAHEMAFPASETTKKVFQSAPISAPVAAGGTLLAIVAQWIEGGFNALKNIAAMVGDLEPVQAMFAQAGANPKAVVIPAILFSAVVVLKKMLTMEDEA